MDTNDELQLLLEAALLEFKSNSENKGRNAESKRSK